MSDHQPSWMPDSERLCMAFDLCDQAWDEIGDGEREPNDSWLDPLRAVVREAVEKALAEQEACYRREVLQAKIEAVRAAAKYSRDAASLEPDDDVGEAHTRTAERLDRMAASYAELAALDAGEEAKP